MHSLGEWKIMHSCPVPMSTIECNWRDSRGVQFTAKKREMVLEEREGIQIQIALTQSPYLPQEGNTGGA